MNSSTYRQSSHPSASTIKADPELKEIQLIRRSRLSVVPLTQAEFERILALGETVLPKAKRKLA